ncbi:hypothetical protein WMY93_004484 [Mugilogobius chulae]|uniref:Uncharacterized protein n=1 Tax=Mugilogobius chulae TaxID=88201 RepID=A0AAW0PSE7_9GOBI
MREARREERGKTTRTRVRHVHSEGRREDEQRGRRREKRERKGAEPRRERREREKIKEGRRREGREDDRREVRRRGERTEREGDRGVSPASKKSFRHPRAWFLALWCSWDGSGAGRTSSLAWSPCHRNTARQSLSAQAATAQEQGNFGIKSAVALVRGRRASLDRRDRPTPTPSSAAPPRPPAPPPPSLQPSRAPPGRSRDPNRRRSGNFRQHHPAVRHQRIATIHLMCCLTTSCPLTTRLLDPPPNPLRPHDTAPVPTRHCTPTR